MPHPALAGGTPLEALLDLEANPLAPHPLLQVG